MNDGMLANLVLTTAVQAVIGGVITVIIRRYVAQVDRIGERLRELEEQRIVKLETSVAKNAEDHTAIALEIAERIGREEQEAIVARIEAVTAKQTETMIQQATTATQMKMASEQIGELFGRFARLSTDVARMQGQSDAQGKHVG